MVDEKDQAKKDSLRAIEIALTSSHVPALPPYPYGLQSWGSPYQPHPLADRALLGGAKILSGNKISKGRNKGKTKRKWLPYIQAVKVKSEAMRTELTILATRACMRTIAKCGGLDEYLLGEKPARLKELGPFGWKLRWLVVNSDMMKSRFASEATQMDMSTPDTFMGALADPKIREELLKAQSEAWQKLKEKDARFEKTVKTQWEKKDKKEYTIKESTTLRTLDPSTLNLEEELKKMGIQLD
jgi:large subunit ribosomal protein L28